MKFLVTCSSEPFKKADYILKTYPKIKQLPCYVNFAGDLILTDIEALDLISLSSIISEELVISYDSSGIHNLEIYDGYRE